MRSTGCGRAGWQPVGNLPHDRWAHRPIKWAGRPGVELPGRQRCPFRTRGISSADRHKGCKRTESQALPRSQRRHGRPLVRRTVRCPGIHCRWRQPRREGTGNGSGVPPARSTRHNQAEGPARDSKPRNGGSHIRPRSQLPISGPDRRFSKALPSQNASKTVILPQVFLFKVVCICKSLATQGFFTPDCVRTVRRSTDWYSLLTRAHPRVPKMSGWHPCPFPCGF